ncbi:MAG: PepSY-associated TM helix domain-containing protein [Planctomycetota bacterium]|nr:PepSY-associated TM helix domain-containing protein [Planctomycetota bacterium]
MSTFKFFFTVHKWAGIILAVVFSVTAVTGFLLLVKKKVDWIQPPTQKDVAVASEDFITNQQLFEIVFAQDHPDFQSMEDIDRVDFRPGKRVFKVRSEHNHSEMQVGAVSGEVLSSSWRMSDLLEDIHDGSFFADWIHEWFMPAYAVVLLFMVFSGLWMWIEPKVRRARRKKRAARQAAGS